jgi:hypothetical protein
MEEMRVGNDQIDFFSEAFNFNIISIPRLQTMMHYIPNPQHYLSEASAKIPK